MSSLGGQVAVVTGAARGIGAAIASALADAGASVVGVDVERSDSANAVQCDLADPAQLARLVPGIVAQHGRLDILINNAGMARHNAVMDLREADLDLMWAVNARATMLLCRDALQRMAEQGGGQIVNVVSTAGLRGGPGESAYCATKFAVRGFTEGLVDEARLVGVRVHGVYPAGVDTGFWSDATAKGPGVDTGAFFLKADDVAAVVVGALTSPAHVHMPELVVRAVADGDADGTRRKLEWFKS